MRIGRKKSMIDRAHDYVESVSDNVVPQLEAALEAARDKAGPAITDARDKAAPVLAEGRAIAATKAAAAAALAAEKTASSRDFATAKVAELRHEPEPKHAKLKKWMVLGALLAIGGVVFSKLKAKSSGSDNWQSSYVPKPPPAPTAAPASPGASAPVTPAAPASGFQGDPLTDPISLVDPEHPTAHETDDVAGGAPGEALSDHAETPHQVTTPDSPATVTDVDDVPDTKS